MSWESETNEIILFTSPELNVFSGKWISGERSGEKKLGIFDPPRFKGSIIQDLNVKSTAYPITVYFDGPFHFKDANKFWKALSEESGQWEIVHPTKGILVLQLSTFREVIDPTTSGDVTVFETSWLEPANIERFISSAEFGALTLLSVINTIQDAIIQAQQLKSDLYAAVQGVLSTINRIVGLSDSFMSEMAALDTIVNDAWNEAKNTFNLSSEKFQSTPSDPDAQAELAQSFIDIITIPLESNSDYSNRMATYTDFTNEILLNPPSGNTDEDFNKALFLELGAIGSLMGICRIIVTSDFTTRAEVISAMDNLTTVFNDTINALETVQENFL